MPVGGSDGRDTVEPQVDASRFELQGRIGAGNHGVVFRALDRHLGRQVAIKRFSHFLADDPRAMRRITREVETLARVSHPNVVTVHDLVRMPDGDGEVTPHLVMELVEGTSLRDLLALRGPSPRSVVVVAGVLDGLAACHRAGILHLDIKPANVLVTDSGGIKIVDFGIARAASEYSGVEAMARALRSAADDVTGSAASAVPAPTSAPDAAVSPPVRSVATPPVVLAPPAAAAAPLVRPLSRPADLGDRPDAVARAATPDHTSEPATPAQGPAVTRWTRLVSLLLGLGISAVVLTVVPMLAWASLELAPARVRPEAMDQMSADAWWMLSVGLALVLLLVRRRRFFRHLAGPEVGSPLPDGPLAPTVGRGVRMALGAALVGTLPLLVPWYVLGLLAGLTAAGAPAPGDPFADVWTTAWVLAPLVAVVLGLRGILGMRPRLGALAFSFLLLVAAGGAAAFFLLAGPYVL